MNGVLGRAVATARGWAGRVVAGFRARARARAVRAAFVEREEFLELVGLPSSTEAAAAAIRARRLPFVLADPREAAEVLRSRVPSAVDRVLEEARLAREHVFDLLGSGPTRLAEIDWHLDWKTGVRWPARSYQDVPLKPAGAREDVKVPWELSRFYHASALGRAFALTGDEAFADELRAQILSWVRANPFAASCNWMNAMEVGLRSIGWIVGLELARGSRIWRDADFVVEVHRQLFLNGRFIERNFEVHGRVTGNHFLSDAVGLLAIGAALPACEDALAWRELGGALVEREVLVQVREDGVDYENAVAYHRLVAELLVFAALCLRCTGRGASVEMMRRLERMLDYTLAYSRPDGSVPWVGDDDAGRGFVLEPVLADHGALLAIGAALFDRADMKRPGLREPLVWLLGADGVRRFDAASRTGESGSRHFEESRVAVLASEDAHVFLDAGDVGIEGFGSHGHDEGLSVEIWLRGEALVRDAGTFVYTADLEKRFFARSIRAHNTVVVDGAEASGLSRSEPWRTLQEMPCRIDAFSKTARGGEARASHDGYRRLGVRHERRVVVFGGEVLVEDVLTGEGEHVFRWQMLTLGEARVEGSGFVVGRARVLVEGEGERSIEDAVASPTYGVEQPARRLVVTFRGKCPAAFKARFVPL